MFKFLKKIFKPKEDTFEIFIKKNPYYLQETLYKKEPAIEEEPDPVPALVLAHTILSTNGVAEDFSHELVEDFSSPVHETWDDGGAGEFGGAGASENF